VGKAEIAIIGLTGRRQDRQLSTLDSPGKYHTDQSCRPSRSKPLVVDIVYVYIFENVGECQIYLYCLSTYVLSQGFQPVVRGPRDPHPRGPRGASTGSAGIGVARIFEWGVL